MSAEATAAARPSPPAENILLNLVCNVFGPGILLSKLSKEAMLGPKWGLVVALALPVGYGIWDYQRRRTWNIFSLLGFVGTLLTGLLGLMKLPGIWVAVKEASIPLILGFAIPLSMRTKQPIVKTLLMNDQLMDTARIQDALVRRGTEPDFDSLMRSSAWILAGSFFFSAILNFALAQWLLKASPGTPEFNAQLGRMNMLSWVVIALPCMIIMAWAMVRLLKGLEKISGLSQDEILRVGTKETRKT